MAAISQKLSHLLPPLVTLSLLQGGCGRGTLEDSFPDGQTTYIRIPHSLVRGGVGAFGDIEFDHKQDDKFVFGYIDGNKLKLLPDEFREQIVALPPAFSFTDFDAKTLTPKVGGGDGDARLKLGYHNYDQLTGELKALVEAFPNVVKLESAGQSVQGRELWYVKISDLPDLDEEEPKFLLVANMHGDEVIGREILIKLARHLAEGVRTDQRIKALVNQAQIYIMPSMNPDGFELMTRKNANGKDLNRDFPDFVGDPIDDPMDRQPETKNMMKLHEQHHFILGLNFHGGALCFNLPWDTRENKASSKFKDDALISKWGRQYADTNLHMQRNGHFTRGLTYGYEWTRVEGGMQDWANYFRRSIHGTVEVSLTKWPHADDIEIEWQRNRRAIIEYLERGLFGLHLKIVDPKGQGIAQPEVTIAAPIERTLSYTSATIHRPTLTGQQRVQISAPGYVTRIFYLQPWTFNSQIQKIVLQPGR